MSKCYVYAWRNVNNGKMNIGYKSPNGEEHTYITSLKNTEFWKDYSYGLLKRSILYIGEENESNIAKSVEWFALKYAVATAKDHLYNAGNNGAKGDETLIPKATKQLVIDYIEGRSEAMPLLKKDEDAHFAENLSNRIKNGEFEIHQIPRVEIEKYSRNQVRTKDKVIDHIRNIRTKIIENPTRSRELYGPIVVVVKNSGQKMIVDGNSRIAATEGIVGWEILPVIFINENEFGESELQREDNYDLVGLYENRAAEEIKEENSWSDLKRNIVNYLVRHNLDFSNDILYNNLDSRGNRFPLLDDRYVEFVKNNAEIINAKLDFNKDYEFDYFGLRTLERAYLMRLRSYKRVNKKKIGRAHV